jgi:hypothetical protein
MLNTLIALLLILLISSVLSSKLDAQRNEIRRQYEDYLRLFNKQEKPNSYAMFMENLSRISFRDCDRFVNRYTDEELTFVDCEERE